MPHLGHTSQKIWPRPYFMFHYAIITLYTTYTSTNTSKNSLIFACNYYTLAYNKPFINTPYLELIST